MTPGSDGSVWTVDQLKQHFDQRLLDQDKAVQAALAAAEKAVAAALAAAEKAREQAQNDAMQWRANANEWRGSMVDREQRFASREEMTSELKAVRASIESLKESRAEAVGSKAVVAVIVSVLIAAGMVMLSRYVR